MKIRSHKDLDVYKLAFESAMEIYQISKLTDSEGEAAETQTWLDFALACNYIKIEEYNSLFEKYNNIIGKLVNMSLHPENWTF